MIFVVELVVALTAVAADKLLELTARVCLLQVVFDSSNSPEPGDCYCCRGAGSH